MYVCMCVYIYIYICIERERERYVTHILYYIVIQLITDGDKPHS